MIIRMPNKCRIDTLRPPEHLDELVTHSFEVFANEKAISIDSLSDIKLLFIDELRTKYIPRKDIVDVLREESNSAINLSLQLGNKMVSPDYFQSVEWFERIYYQGDCTLHADNYETTYASNKKTIDMIANIIKIVMNYGND